MLDLVWMMRTRTSHSRATLITQTIITAYFAFHHLISFILSAAAPLYVSIANTDGWASLELNEPAVFNCTVRSAINRPLPRVEWRLNDQLVGHSGPSNPTSWRSNPEPIVNNMAHSGSAVYQITTDRLKLSDVGKLACFAGTEEDVYGDDSVIAVARGESLSLHPPHPSSA